MVGGRDVFTLMATYTLAVYILYVTEELDTSLPSIKHIVTGQLYPLTTKVWLAVGGSHGRQRSSAIHIYNQQKNAWNNVGERSFLLEEKAFQMDVAAVKD